VCNESKLLNQECLLEKMGLSDCAGGNWDAVLAIYTDAIRWTDTEQFCAEVSTKLDKLLEVRAYNKDSEFHAVRSFMGEAFSWRIVCDEDYASDAMIDDEQALDVNSRHRRTVGNHYVATGGGDFDLPLAGAKSVVLRNYIVYDEDGLAGVDDFRIVRLQREGE
jgi:hypothetical protein